MACVAIITGDDFVLRMLTHIDCQSRYLGTYGYQTLGEPGSTAATAMAGLLTLFVAIWGFRLLFGTRPAHRDVVQDILKVGIVLTLAFSWPAFRTLIYDVVLDGPAQIAASLSTPGLTSTASGFAERMQSVDNAIVRFTEIGTGRNSGGFLDQDAIGGTFAGSALDDESAFGWARLVYLISLIGSLALLRLVAGLLLALAPLVAGLMLFEASRGIFVGWLRGLVLCLLGAVGVTVVLAVELAVLEPWLGDALRVRSLGYATPSAPLELFAMVVAFGMVKFLVIWLLAKVSFSAGRPSVLTIFADKAEQLAKLDGPQMPSPAVADIMVSRAQRLANQLNMRIGHDDRETRSRIPELRGPDVQRLSEQSAPGGTLGNDRLGSSYRRKISVRTSGTTRRGVAS